MGRLDDAALQVRFDLSIAPSGDIHPVMRYLFAEGGGFSAEFAMHAGSSFNSNPGLL